ncbi:hypothetical protein [Pedobacter hiemivivus]|uniref:Uncharacterized protein n=1 Tax=Pedobacter hiemivivus TaxID=2530454 RepID=A0A4R0MNG5_9SPHI|nr:hypothetical protein [Pedobacter hiemivivus]TCC88341.1 hypothetical protein EZ444_22010 [Pedobacter hiemivivus]
MMNTKTQPLFRLEMDPNKLDSKIKSFEYNGNHYLYVCHLNVYSTKAAGHHDDRPDQVKYLIKSFYGKYLDEIVPLKDFEANNFYEKLAEDIDAHLISIEGSY